MLNNVILGYYINIFDNFSSISYNNYGFNLLSMFLRVGYSTKTWESWFDWEMLNIASTGVGFIVPELQPFNP